MARILALSNMYPPHHYGGYELSCRDVVSRWRARGHEVTILTTDNRVAGVADPPDDRTNGIRRDLRWYWEDHRLLKPSIRERLAIERGNQRALTDAIAASRPDVVSAWNMGAMSLGLLTTIIEKRIPLVLVVCDLWLLYGPELDPWARMFVGRPRLGRFVRRRVGVPTTIGDLGRGAIYCFVSDAVRRKTEAESLWFPRVSTVTYSGIDRADFPEIPSSGAARPWRWRLLYVGRLDDRKGVHVLIEAMTKLPEDATLVIHGRGDASYQTRLRHLADERGLAPRVRFEVTDRSELARIYREADAVVFTPLWDEPFGLVPVEAMACGTPVIATATGGATEFLVDGVNCVRVKPGEADAIADAARRLASDPALRARLVEGGFRTAEVLDVDRLAEVLETWHLAAIDGFAGGRPPDRQLTIA